MINTNIQEIVGHRKRSDAVNHWKETNPCNFHHIRLFPVVSLGISERHGATRTCYNFYKVLVSHFTTTYNKRKDNTSEELSDNRLEDERDNEAVKTQSLGENEDEDHSDIHTLLLGNGADTSISHNTNSKPSGKTGKSNRKASSKRSKSRFGIVALSSH